MAAGSAFAILQSAGAGGAGLAIVNAVVGASAAAVAVGATATGIITAEENGELNDEEEIQEKEENPNQNE